MPSFAGEFRVSSDQHDVYAFLVDPNSLVKCLPDLRHHAIQDQDHLNVTLRVGLGRVRGPLTMNIEIVEKRENSYARVVGKGKMLGSGVAVDCSFTLSGLADGTTRVTWNLDGKFGAYLKHLVGDFLDKIVQERVELFTQAVEVEMTAKATP